MLHLLTIPSDVLDRMIAVIETVRLRMERKG